MADHICLIVDGDQSIRTLLRAILEEECLQILEADNAAQALKIVHKLGECLDVIVMPGDMDGVDLAYSIRHSFPTIPVVLCADEESVKYANFGFSVVLKPLVRETVFDAFRQAMSVKIPSQSETTKPLLRKMTG